jgi:small subunit ribosomal protein S21
MIKMEEQQSRTEYKAESFESMLRRFKRKVEQEGILREIRDRKHYEKPSERKRRKAKGRR